MKRFISAIMASTLIFSAVGCSNNNSKKENTIPTVDQSSLNPDEPGWMRTADDKVKLQWYINFSWFPTEWGKDITSKTITEETGVDIEFIVPAGSEAEKLNTMIASNTLPDLLTLGWYEGQVNSMIDGELIYALNELADKYDPYFFKVADPTRVSWYTKPDGNIYGYPNASYSPDDYKKYDNIASNKVFLVRKDIYEAIGSPEMSTPDGFLNALKKAKEMFPTVNNQPIIPLGLAEFGEVGNWSLEEYLQDFLAIPYEKDGKFYDRSTDPEYIKWLKVLRQAGQDGLLLQDIFIDKRAQMGEKVAQGRYFAMMYQRTDIAAEQKILYDKDPNSIYMAVDGPKNSNKDNPTLGGTGIQGWTVTMISKNCKRPDKAIQFMSYLMSEHGQKMVFLGPEGVTWDNVDGKPVVKPDVLNMLNTDRAQYDATYGGDDTYWMLMDNPMQANWSQGTPEALAQMEQWTYPYTISISQYNDLNPPTGTEEEIIGLKVSNLFGKELPKLLLAPTEAEFDKIWDNYIKQREELGYGRLFEYKSKKVEENKAKLGIK